MSMLQEFKEFAVKGNVMDLAVGVAARFGSPDVESPDAARRPGGRPEGRSPGQGPSGRACEVRGAC